uniref:Uncharacterized protein n=1 Tax=Oryza punctata TaxID=4537 RepID=A0A0E0KDH2_ORYPU
MQTVAAGTSLGKERSGGGMGAHTAAAATGLDDERAGGVGRGGECGGSGEATSDAITNLGDGRARQSGNERGSTGGGPVQSLARGDEGPSNDGDGKDNCGSAEGVILAIEPAGQMATATDEPVSKPAVVADNPAAASNEPVVMEGEPGTGPSIEARSGPEGIGLGISLERGGGLERGDLPKGRGGPNRGAIHGEEALEPKLAEDQLQTTWDPEYHKRQKEVPPIWMPLLHHARGHQKRKRESALPLGVMQADREGATFVTMDP